MTRRLILGQDHLYMHHRQNLKLHKLYVSGPRKFVAVRVFCHRNCSADFDKIFYWTSTLQAIQEM